MPALDTTLPAYPTVRPTPRPTPPTTPSVVQPATPKRAPIETPQFLQLDKAAEGFTKAADAERVATEGLAAASGKEAAAQAALQTEQNEYIEGLRNKEAQELRGLDQGPFKPTQDTFATMGALFTMAGMLGAFMGGKGTAAAGANAQAALTGMLKGWNQGDEQVVREQKAIFDTNAAYLKDKANQIRDLYKQYQEDAVKFGIPTAQGRLHQRLVTEAQADVNAQRIKLSGAQAAAKQAESIFKMADAFEGKRLQMMESRQRQADAFQERLAIAALSGSRGSALNQRFAFNMSESYAQAVQDIINVTKLPKNTALGAFSGLTGQSGHSLIGGLQATFARKITPDDQRQMQQLVSGLEFNLGRALGGGYANSSSRAAIEQFKAQIPQAGDSPAIYATFLARIKQELGTYAGQFQDYPGANQHQKDVVADLYNKLDSVIPFDLDTVLQAAEPAARGGGGPQEGQTSTSKSGKPIVFRDGKWVYAGQ